jgi:hypothetical protein
MTLLLTEGGQVAGAVEASGSVARTNAVGIVRDGKVQMLCGTAQIEIDTGDAAKTDGQLVRIASTAKGAVSLSNLSGGVSGTLDVTARTLGSKALTENVLIFRDGASISLSDLTSAEIPSSQIVYARTNWAGKVDLIVLNNTKSSTVIYGRVFWEVTRIPASEDDPDAEDTYEEKLGVRYGNGTDDKVGPFSMKYNVQTGDYVAVTVNRGKTGFSSLIKLTALKNVSNSAWSGRTAVTVSGRTYTVPSDVLCYNADSQLWVDLSTAHAYANTCTLYVEDGVVRAIEVKSK